MQRSALDAGPPFPLVVDVDGGLLACDPVREGIRQAFIRSPFAMLRGLSDHPRRADQALKAALARPGAPVLHVPVRSEALDAIETWQRLGGNVILLSRLPETMLAHVAEQIGIKAALFGSRTKRPLMLPDKAALLPALVSRDRFFALSHAKHAETFCVGSCRAMIADLTPALKRRLRTWNIRAVGLAGAPLSASRVTLRAGPGWALDWAGLASAASHPPVTPEKRRPSPDVSDAERSQRGRAARS